MLNCAEFVEILGKRNIDFFTGVPDSLLKNLCSYLQDNVSSNKNIIAANEGGAVAIASGHYLATGNPGVVYLQNSGQGNILNPLLSLADEDVYSIPVLLLIGWRGEPGKADEPQHFKQGKVTVEIFDTIGVPYEILPNDGKAAEEIIEKACRFMQENLSPFALIVKKETFQEHDSCTENKNEYTLKREEAIEILVDSITENDVIVSTTGKASRELFEYREKLGQDHSRDFLTVGSMGHASQIALGLALKEKKRNIYCLDGDGAFIMHMGGISTIGKVAPNNFKHIVINNGAHESVGGQPTHAFDLDIPSIALACGYKKVYSTTDRDEYVALLQEFLTCPGPALLEVRVAVGSRNDLGRPTTSPIDNKKQFMDFLSL